MTSLLLALVMTAGAQEVTEAPQINANLYRPPIDARLTNWADDSGWAPGSWVMGKVVFNYMNDPLQYTYDDGEIVDVLTDAMVADVVAGVSFGRIRVGVDVPITLASYSPLASGGAGLGDIAIDIKGNALDRGKHGTGVAFGLRGVANTSTADAPLGDPLPFIDGQLILDRRFNNLFFTGNFGARVTAYSGDTNTQWLARPFVRGGGGWHVAENGGLSLDVAAMSSQVWPLSDPMGIPIEYMAGGWYKFGDSLVLRGGLGRGLTRAVGAPRARALVSVGYEPPREADSDLDTVLDRVDECPFEPEDRDQFEDEDGCPELDNDNDGVEDADDACANEAEDLDGFEDSDGCAESPTEVHLRVNGPDGSAVANAKITVSGAGTSPKWGGADYRVVLEPGSYSMVAEADGYKKLELTFEVPEGERVERIERLALEDPRGTLAVTVLGGHGRALRGAQISVDGAFIPLAELGELEPGPWQAHVRAPGWGTVELVTRIGEGSVTEESVVLPDNRVELGAASVDLLQPVIFAEGGIELDDASVLVLDDIAGLLLDDDDISVTLSATGESELALKRAKAAKDRIVRRGVSGSRLTIASEPSSADGESMLTVRVVGGSE